MILAELNGLRLPAPATLLDDLANMIDASTSLSSQAPDIRSKMASVRMICAHTVLLSLHVGGSEDNSACLALSPAETHSSFLPRWMARPQRWTHIQVYQCLTNTTNSPQNTIKTPESRYLYPRRLEQYTKSLGQRGPGYSKCGDS